MQVFVATTNIGNGQSLSRTITYQPYPDNTSKTALCYRHLLHLHISNKEMLYINIEK